MILPARISAVVSSLLLLTACPQSATDIDDAGRDSHNDAGENSGADAGPHAGSATFGGTMGFDVESVWFAFRRDGAGQIEPNFRYVYFTSAPHDCDASEGGNPKAPFAYLVLHDETDGGDPSMIQDNYAVYVSALEDGGTQLHEGGPEATFMLTHATSTRTAGSFSTQFFTGAGGLYTFPDGGTANLTGTFDAPFCE